LIVAIAGFTAPSAGEELPQDAAAEPINVSARSANRWFHGSTEVWTLLGNCRISQGTNTATAHEAVVWIDHAADPRGRSTLSAYLEGNVQVEPDKRPENQPRPQQLEIGPFHTTQPIRVQTGYTGGEPEVKPAVYLRGVQRRRPPPSSMLRRTQYTEPAGETILGQTMPGGTRRIWAGPRSDSAGAQAVWEHNPETNEWVGVIDGGVMMNIYGPDADDLIGISTDRVVIWTSGLEQLDLSGASLQSADLPLEVYLEGNIIFRQDQRVIHAKRMYYDLTNESGTVLEAEMLSPVPEYDGILRLKADKLRQAGKGRYFAENTFITSSRMGEPGYRIQSGNVYFEDNEFPLFDSVTGTPVLDPKTGTQAIGHDRSVTSQNNFLFLGKVPIFYWPTLATNLEDPTFYIRRARIKNDSVYGTQLLTNWSVFELLGMEERPAGTDWEMSLDFLGDRGFGHGTTLKYNRDGFLRFPGHTTGLLDYWGIEDRGTDNLGAGRRSVAPDKDYRHRLFWQHRQQLPADVQLSAEVGLISDRNFLEEYYKREWDELKDQSTGVELKQINNNRSWSVSADARLNDFFTQTEWLPRADHFWLGQSLLGGRLSWYEHSHLGYARMKPVDTAAGRLPWEAVSTEGEVFATRHEIDMPFRLGPVKLVPFALGELAHWGEDLTGDDLQRWYWRTGLRASLPMWRTDPDFESRLLNVHGLAHKIVFSAEASVAEANRSMFALPSYEPLDDDSIEAFRRSFAMAGPQFDPRSYALRSGMGSWVTAPSTEIADDMMALRFGARQRWQTKRGMPGNRKIVDWVVLDTGFTWFPDENDDNFGESMGLANYDFRWHVGDRLTLLSDGVFDFFSDGQQLITFGTYLSRPPRGSLYLGLRLLEGPISSQVLSLSYSYWMSPKWVSSFGTSIDLGDEGNIGQRFAITRIGESLLVSAGFTVDAARDNVGFKLAVEPRFLPKSRLGRVGGARIPMAGEYGLE